MLFRYTHRGGVWIDLESPTEDEVRAVVKEFSIDERLESELLSPTPTSVVASGTNMVFLVLHFPVHNAGGGEMRDQEIDIIASHDFIITTHYEVIEPFHRLQKLLETQQIITTHDAITTDVLLEILFTHLYTSVRDYIDHVVDRLNRVERDMFNGLERTTVRLISNISREFLHIDAALANQEEPLNRFLATLAKRGLFNESFAERAERMRAERAQIAQLSTTHRAVATELRETNTALLGARQNEIMKMLTMITVIVLPLELIAFIIGMHVPGTPLEGNPNAFAIIMLFMLATVGVMTAFFARKRWL